MAYKRIFSGYREEWRRSKSVFKSRNRKTKCYYSQKKEAYTNQESWSGSTKFSYKVYFQTDVQYLGCFQRRRSPETWLGIESKEQDKLYDWVRPKEENSNQRLSPQEGPQDMQEPVKRRKRKSKTVARRSSVKKPGLVQRRKRNSFERTLLIPMVTVVKN